MIVKNEESTLERCLSSISGAVDEIIIVDTGSNDKTKEIAVKFTDKIYDFNWCEDFSKARNYAFSKAKSDYCMWLDADDVFDNPDSLAELKSELDADVVMMKYNSAFDENGNPALTYYRERIIKNNAGFAWEGAVHEVIAPRGKIIYSDLSVSHKSVKTEYSDRNLKIFQKLLRERKILSPREQFYYARELYYHSRYAEAAKTLEAFLESGVGWIENNIEACRILAFCFYALGDRQSALSAMFRSFVYDAPRAEICCDIGQHFVDEGSYETAVFWYETALTRPLNPQSGGFVLIDCYGYIPCLQLCVCFDRLGNYKKAEEYNERAGAIKPQSQAYLSNKIYFKER